MKIGRLTTRRSMQVVLWVLILLLPLEPSLAAVSLVQDDFTKQLQEARDKFVAGDIDSSIAIVNRCLSQPDFPSDLKQKAYELLSESYMALNYIEQARTAIRNLLELVPNYVAPPDNPALKAEVERIKQTMPKPVPPQVVQADTTQGKVLGKKDMKQEKDVWYEKTWVQITGGVLVAGGLALLLIKKPPPPPPPPILPDPPSFPPR